MYVWVQFEGSQRLYTYKTNLSLHEGYIYSIIADGTTTYNSRVKVTKLSNNRPNIDKNIAIREITDANLVWAPPHPKMKAKVKINEKKGTTVILWSNGEKTIVKCQPGEKFDAEKGVAMCFMKRYFKNRGWYNDWMREVLEENGIREE